MTHQLVLLDVGEPSAVGATTTGMSPISVDALPADGLPEKGLMVQVASTVRPQRHH